MTDSKQFARNVLDALGLTYTVNATHIALPCCIHMGDNPQALTIFTTELDGHVLTLNAGPVDVKHVVGRTFNDFVYAILKLRNIKTTKEDAAKFIEQHAGKLTVSQTKSPTIFSPVMSLTREQARSKLVIPAKYYMERGYSKEVLDEYDVGLSLAKGKSMYMRSVVLFYAEEKVIGCIGRNINPQCPTCKFYHSVKRNCPVSLLEKIWGSKWRVCKGFYTGHYLYNYWRAKDFIREKGYCILVEGCGDVWRLEEANIKSGLAILGNRFTKEKKKLLESLEVKKIYACFDADNGGKVAFESIHEHMKDCEIIPVKLPKKDFGEMHYKEVRDFMWRIINERL